MQRLIPVFLCVALSCLVSLASNAAFAGNGGHKHFSGLGNNFRNHNSPSAQPANVKVARLPKVAQVANGGQGGMGFIADPLLHGKSPKSFFNHGKVSQPGTNATKIMDPIRIKPGNTAGNTGKIINVKVADISQFGTTGTTPKVIPVVRDHSVPKPVSPVTQPMRRDGAITSEGIGLNTDGIADLFGLDGSGFGIGFSAPQQFDHLNDHRSQPGTGGFQADTNGPANSLPGAGYHHPGRGGGR
jgi:hypothetical protein